MAHKQKGLTASVQTICLMHWFSNNVPIAHLCSTVCVYLSYHRKWTVGWFFRFTEKFIKYNFFCFVLSTPKSLVPAIPMSASSFQQLTIWIGSKSILTDIQELQISLSSLFDFAYVLTVVGIVYFYTIPNEIVFC